MLSREEIEQMIDQKIEPLTEEIAALKAQLGKVDILAIDNRNIQQSLGRIETAQESLKFDFERQEKQTIRFEKQTNEQLTDLKADVTILKTDAATLKEQLALAVTMLRRVLPPEEQR
jgi:cell shape-determining protein MreC